MSDRVDRAVLGRWTGIPLFLLVMCLMFQFTVNVGGAFIDFFDGTAGAVIVDGSRELLGPLGASQWLQVLLVDGLGAGLQVIDSSIRYRIIVGPQQGRKVLTLRTLPACDESFSDRVGKVAGFSLHAGVAAKAATRSCTSTTISLSLIRQRVD